MAGVSAKRVVGSSLADLRAPGKSDDLPEDRAQRLVGDTHLARQLGRAPNDLRLARRVYRRESGRALERADVLPCSHALRQQLDDLAIDAVDVAPPLCQSDGYLRGDDGHGHGPVKTKAARGINPRAAEVMRALRAQPRKRHPRPVSRVAKE